MFLIQHLIIIISTLYCVFLFACRSEPSLLINHLVKFVSSGNLLWIAHHILLKTKTQKVQPIKCAILKSTHIMWYSEHGFKLCLSFLCWFFPLNFSTFQFFLSSSNFNFAFKFLLFTISPFYSLRNLKFCYWIICVNFFPLSILLESYVLSVLVVFKSMLLILLLIVKNEK